MIGQKNLQSRIEQLIENHTFPRFSILVGPKGSGKKMLADEIKELFNKHNNTDEYIFSFRVQDVKIDTVRDVIKCAYSCNSTAIYIIPDADNMSNAAKNALLKVTEEPPNEAYFIMTLEDENNTLETIRSRGTVFHMDRYTPDEIYQYACDFDHCDTESYKLFTSICETPGEVDILKKMGSKEFYDYVQLVVDNIAEVSLSNAFKIPSKVALKDDAEGYDLRLFWKAFISVCRERSQEFYEKDSAKYWEGIIITSKHLQSLRIKGINKQMLIDDWVINIRMAWT